MDTYSENKHLLQGSKSLFSFTQKRLHQSAAFSNSSTCSSASTSAYLSSSLGIILFNTKVCISFACVSISVRFASYGVVSLMSSRSFAARTSFSVIVAILE